MRRWFVRWLKTQWTAIPLAFLIVTAVELWRLEDKSTDDDGHSGREARGPAAKPRSADATNIPFARPPTDQLPSTKSLPKNAEQPTGKWTQQTDVVRRAVSSNDGTQSNRSWREYRQTDIHVNTSGTIVNPHPFKYIINCPNLCRGADVFLLNYVHTAVSHFARRARIRKTWALQSHYRNFTIRTVFFVGISNKTPWYQDALFYESRKYGDIVQKDFLDTYR